MSRANHGAPLQSCSSCRFKFGPASKQRGSACIALCRGDSEGAQVLLLVLVVL